MNQFKATMLGLVNEQVRNFITSGNGVVLGYSQEHNTADVLFNHPNGDKVNLSNVQVRFCEGLTTPDLSAGTDVILSFPTGNLFDCTIVSTIDRSYQMNVKDKSRHRRKGSYVPDQISTRGVF